MSLTIDPTSSSRRRLPSHLRAETNDVRKMGFTLSIEASILLLAASHRERRTYSDIVDEMIRDHLGKEYEIVKGPAPAFSAL